MQTTTTAPANGNAAPANPTSIIEPYVEPVNLDLPPTSAGDAETDIEILKSVPTDFAIEDEKSANWLIKKVVAARQYAQRVKEWAEQEQRRAEREEQCLMYLFGRQLERWTREEIGRLKGKRKSLNLPGGSIGFRKINPSLQIDDEVVVINWARTHCPRAVTTVTVEKLSRTDLKAHFEATGEMPDRGAHVERGGERFFVG